MTRKEMILVGANGRLGRALFEACRDQYTLAPLTRHDLDLQWSREKIHEALGPYKADILLLAAGNTNVDYCEIRPDEAERLNATAVRHIAEWCADTDTRLINFSSDYVFDGEKNEPYTEEDPVNPISEYGKSKLLGEEMTLEASDRNLVVRLAWLFGPGKPAATPDWAVQMAVETDTLSIVADRTGSPSYTRDLATGLIPLLFDESATGILHLCNSESCTWQEWGQFCVDCAIECGVDVKTREVGALKMDEIFGNRANRPRYSVLSTEKYQSLTGRTLPPWQDAVREYIRERVAPRFL
jgi:dTDP-4-dehydrorhamnose reductase